MNDEISLWVPTPDRIAKEPLTAFRAEASRAAGRNFSSYAELHRWSVDHREEFWSLLWDFCGVVGKKGDRTLIDVDRMQGVSFFPEARLNFAENLLRKRGPSDAIVFKGEDKVVRRLSWDDLNALVSRLQQLFASMGLQKGDRVAAMMPNMPESVAGMLAAASLGAVWSSCSPDFDEQGVLDRFAQIEPVLFLAPDGYWYNGKQNDVTAKVRAVLSKLTSVRKAILVDYLGTARQTVTAIPRAVALDDALAPFEAKQVTFERMPFNHPLYILFSSGTTGIPKCIVHGAGGTLLQHLKEQQLHGGIRDGDRLFYFTTCGWMMWNWLVSALATGATLLLYDGSPFHPNGNDASAGATREELVDAIVKAIDAGGLFSVNVDIVHSQIGQAAHVILPAVESGEMNLTSMNGERRMRLVEKYMDGPGSAMPDCLIAAGIAQNLERVLREGGRAAYADQFKGYDWKTEEDAFMDGYHANTGKIVTYERLRAMGNNGVQEPVVDFKDGKLVGTKRLYADGKFDRHEP